MNAARTFFFSFSCRLGRLGVTTFDLCVNPSVVAVSDISS